MSVKSFLGKQIAKIIVFQTKKWINNPIKTQRKVFNRLIKESKETLFGRDHYFSSIKSYEDFKANVPIRDYEGFKPYIERIQNGEVDILWKGTPLKAKSILLLEEPASGDAMQFATLVPALSRESKHLGLLVSKI